MDKERNLGVTEARFALTLLTCLLVAIGYVALLRLAGPKESVADTSPDDASPPSVAAPDAGVPKVVETEPQVVPLEQPDDGRVDRAPQLTNRTAAPAAPTKSERR